MAANWLRMAAHNCTWRAFDRVDINDSSPVRVRYMYDRMVLFTANKPKQTCAINFHIPCRFPKGWILGVPVNRTRRAPLSHTGVNLQWDTRAVYLKTTIHFHRVVSLTTTDLARGPDSDTHSGWCMLTHLWQEYNTMYTVWAINIIKTFYLWPELFSNWSSCVIGCYPLVPCKNKRAVRSDPWGTPLPDKYTSWLWIAFPVTLAGSPIHLFLYVGAWCLPIKREGVSARLQSGSDVRIRVGSLLCS